MRPHYIHVSMDVRIRGYFSKLKGVREKKRLRNIDVDYWDDRDKS